MAIDPRQLKPSELCRLLNSTPLGEVINERKLYRHRTRAGYRIGNDRTVDLLRYAAWLFQIRHQPSQPPPEKRFDYDDVRELARNRNRELSLAGREIGEIPDVVHPDRRHRAKESFRFFCESYFPQTFHLGWSDDHLRVIAKIEQAVLKGGLFAMAMPRGAGKTTICECACI